VQGGTVIETVNAVHLRRVHPAGSRFAATMYELKFFRSVIWSNAGSDGKGVLPDQALWAWLENLADPGVRAIE
jgi:hypothetical protein